MGFVNLRRPNGRLQLINLRRYISIAALAFSAPVVIIAFFLPDKKLGYVPDSELYMALLHSTCLSKWDSNSGLFSDGRNLVSKSDDRTPSVPSPAEMEPKREETEK